MGARAVATLVLVTVIFSGPLQPIVFAQPAQDTTGQPQVQEPSAPPEPAAPPPLPEPPIPQPAMQPPPPEPATPQPAMQAPPPPAAAPQPVMQPAPPPPAAQQPPPVVVVTPPGPRRTGADIYSFGAGVMTIAKMPFNVGLCTVGTVLGAGLFIITLGSGYRAATRTVEEGCRGPWIVTGDDIRPDGPRRNLDYYQR